MANITSNSLFIVSALVLVAGLLFIAYPFLTFAVVILCALGHTYHSHSATFGHFYSQISSALWPLEGGNERQSSYASTLLGGVDLPSPIAHVPSGLETLKNRRSPVDEIVSSTPRSTPSSSYGGGTSLPLPLPLRSSPTTVVTDSRQLNFGRINTPRSSRSSPQEVHQNHVESNLNLKPRNKTGCGKTVQTTVGPLLPSGRYNPPFDAGIYANVNSPGFTDRLVRCASDTGLNWGQTNLATQQDRYNSVGLFPIVHLNAPATPSLSPKNSLKAPYSNVRVRIAPPAYSEQRHLYNRGVGPPLKPYVPTREVMRRNDVAKSVLESLQEASRKRIYSQCQEVLEDDAGKKRLRKGDAALPNPNCDIYQYRHIRAPPVPSTLPMNVQNDIHFQGKRMHDDPLSRANEPKRQRQHGKTFPVNNEISSSLSSSKTLLQRLNGNKRKADDEYTDDSNGKHFKESVTPAQAASSSRWLHSHPCDKGESSARTQEVVRTQKKPTTDASSPSDKFVQRKVLVSDDGDQNNLLKKSANSGESVRATSETRPKTVETDLASKLFRKDIVTRSHPKTNISEKKGSSWTQVPPDADERCLLEKNDSSELDRPERFQSLLSRMCGQDSVSLKNAESVLPCAISEEPKGISTTMPSDVGKEVTNMTSVSAVSSNSAVASLLVSTVPLSAPIVCPEPVSKPPLSPFVPLLLSSASMSPPSSFETITSVPLVPNISSFTSQSSGSMPAHAEKANLLERQDKTSGHLSCAPTSSTANTTLSSAKPMFNFSPPSSLTTSSSIQTAVSATASTVNTSNPTSFSPSMFKFIASSSKPISDTYNKPISSVLPQSTPTMPSNPSTVPSQASGFNFLSAQPQSAAASNATISVAGPTSSLEFASKFSFPGQNLQFPSSSGSVLHPQSEPQLNGPASPTSSPSCFTVTSPTLAQASVASVITEGKKSPTGGFSFSGSPFGQSNPNGMTAAPAPLFSFNSATTTSSISGGVVSDSKSTSSGGSITFGTVSTVATQPTKSMAFTFSTPTQRSAATNENPKAPLQFGGNMSTGFSNASQGLFNGFSSGTNSTAPAAPTFGTSSQQHQGSGGFSFGNPSNQSQSTVTFGAAATTAPSIFGDGTPQQSSFSATTTAGFSSQTTGPAFSNSPFGSFTPSNVPFGSPQPSSSPFGSQAATNNPPSFGASPSNPAPSFGNSSAPSSAPSFGGAIQLAFGVPPSADSSFTNNSSAAPPAPNSSFSFGADKPAVSAFNFGANNASSGSTFSFGSSEIQQPNSGSAPFQFGQATSPSSAPAFQFGSPSGQPPVFNFGGTTTSFGTATNPAPIGNFTIGGFSMGSGPTTPQRTRTLQTRRRRI